MNTSIAGAPWLAKPSTKALIAAFDSAGEELRFVGGCVRDTLLGREVKDIDAATPASPQRVMALLEAAGIRALPTGLAHGTVTALVENAPFEITTLRCDVATDGRHATVQFTDDWKEDAARRDFTINALYASTQGELFDYTGGLTHLKPLALVFIGDAEARIEEDALRMLRYFRFAAQLGVTLPAQDAALQAVAKHAAKAERLSGERISQEMFKLLSAEQLTLSHLQLFHSSRLAKVIGLPALPEAEMQALIAQRIHAPLVLLAVWLAGGGGSAERIGARWKLSTDDAKTLTRLSHAPVHLSVTAKEAEMKAALRHFGQMNFIALAQATYALGRGESAWLTKALALAHEWEIPQFPLTGKDALAAGMLPGKALGDALAALEKAWEASNYTLTREELLQRL